MSQDKKTRPPESNIFKKHQPCFNCPSSDAVAVYADGHGYCFSCEWVYKKYPGETSNVVKLNGTYSGITKAKINSNNYTYMKGNKDEQPTTFDFKGPGGQKKLQYKLSKGYDTHYTYTDEEGNTTFIVERQYTDETRQEKRFFPHTKWKNKIDNSTRWQSKAMPEPRTIYNLSGLNKSRSSNLVICEGEKAADAYIKKTLFACTTWSGGAKQVEKNDWKPVHRFETITLFPDNDEEGFTAMHKLARHLVEDLKVPITNIKFVLYPDDFPKKWDMADPVPETVDTDAHRLASNALPYTEAIENYSDIWKKIKPQQVDDEEKNKVERLFSVAENVYYIGELDEMLDLKKDLIMPIKSFDNNYAYLKIGKKKPSTYLLEQEPELFKRANSFEFQPQRPKGINDVQGVPIVNRYRGPSIIAKPGDISMWKDTLIDVFDDEKRAHNMEQYFAYCLQNQGTKALFAPLWISPKKGIGKNWITNALGECYGLKNFRPNLKYKHVIGKFNSWIIGAQFAIINEVFLSKNYNKKQELSEEIKDLITEPYIHIEEKFRRGFDYPNTCNFILISNHEDCMNIADDERRYWVMKLTEKIRYRDYWKPRWDWINEDGKRFLMHHLMDLKIEDPDLYKERAPVTDDMMDLARMSEHPIFKWLDEHRDAETGPFKRRTDDLYKSFQYMAVATDLHRSCNNLRQEGSLEVVIDWLKKRSTSWDPTKNVPTKQITCPDGSRPRTYMLPPTTEPAKEYWIKFLRSSTASKLGGIFGMKVPHEGPKDGIV